ncbi:MAG: LuxR C-terminal-related transcriptional regulator [Phycisphaeraceae bacterium]
MQATLILVTAAEMLRQGLRLLFERDGFDVLADTGSAGDAVRLARELRPAVVLIDLALADPAGAGVVTQIADAEEGVRVVGLAMQSEARLVGQLLQAGASGCVHSDASFDELRQAVKTVAGGQTYLSAGLTSFVIDRYIREPAGNGNGNGHGLTSLTPREREVMRYFAEGYLARDIAKRMKVSVKTVDAHRYQVMQKLKFRGLADLTRYALREGVASLAVPTPEQAN